MNMNLFKKSILLLTGLCVGFTFQSCSDWNDLKPLTPEYPNIQEQNPELYKEYLENLKTYKESDHKYVYAWVNNSQKNATIRPQHLNNIPDSVDVAILSTPQDLNERELLEIAELKTKGTKVLYAINIDQLKKEHKFLVDRALEIEEETGEIVEIEDLNSYLTHKIPALLRLANHYPYDGISVEYIGKSSLHMKPAEKKEYTESEIIFLGFINGWINAHQDKYIVYAGLPQNLINRSILENCKHIIVPTHNNTNESSIKYTISSASGEGIPTDRYIMTAQLPSRDPEEPKIGYWADQSVALISTATLATGNFNYTVAGIGIIDIQNDYYTNPRIYAHTREAISILNPSLK